MKSTFFALAAMTAAGSASAAVSAYGQCGGQGFSGETSCVSGYSCQKQNDYYSQCTPGAADKAATTLTKAASTKAASATKAASKPASTKAATTTKAASSSAQAVKPAATTSNKAASGGVQYAGVNVCC
jgi:hypothetical protein